MFSSNPKLSGSLFNNNNPQRGSSSGNLFANSSSLRSGSSLFPDPPKSSLFQQIPNPFQKSAPPASKEVPIYGTVDYIGKSHVHKTLLYDSFACITGTIKNCSLDELRIQDHYNTKRNLLPPTKKQLVDTTIYKNNSKRHQEEFPLVFNPSGDQNNPFLPGGIFGRNQPSSQAINPQNSQPFGSNTDASKIRFTSGNSFTTTPQTTFASATQLFKTFENPFESQQQAPTNIFGAKPAQNNQVPASQNTKNFAQQTQSKENIPKKQESSPQSVQQNANEKPKEEVAEKQESVVLKPGSFSYEVNKMVLVSSFVSLLQDHKVSVPENLLDNTNFVPKLFKFLEEYNMNLPTENIPQFPLNTLTLISNQPSRTEAQPQTSSKRGKNSKRGSQSVCDKKSQEEKSTKMKVPLKEVSVVESSLNIGKKEEGEKKEASVRVIDRKMLLSDDESPLGSENEEEESEEEEEEKEKKVEIQDEAEVKDEENVVQSSEKGNSESGMVSVDSSDEEESVESLCMSECEKRKKEIVFEI